MSDSSVGIAGQELSAVLGQFVRARTDYVAKQEGTGLGLAICKTFVELEGGGIDIDSTLGQGTTVSIMLPAERIVSANVIGINQSEKKTAGQCSRLTRCDSCIHLKTGVWYRAPIRESMSRQRFSPSIPHSF